MNCASRLVCEAPGLEHVSPLLVDFRWLPAERRIQYKIATVCYSVITYLKSPSYLSDLLELHIPSRTLRSLADNRIFILNRHRKCQGQRAFSFTGPSVWNNLPFSVRYTQILFSFTSQLKAYFFLCTFTGFKLSLACHK